MEGVLNRLCKLLCNALLWWCFFYCCWWWWIKIRVNTLCRKLGPQASQHIMDKERKAHPQRESKKTQKFYFSTTGLIIIANWKLVVVQIEIWNDDDRVDVFCNAPIPRVFLNGRIALKVPTPPSLVGWSILCCSVRMPILLYPSIGIHSFIHNLGVSSV